MNQVTDPEAEVVFYVRDPNVVKREEDADGALLFHPDRDLVKIVNATGLFIFDHLDGRTPLSTVSSKLAEAFEVDQQTAAHDVSTFVDVLVGCGLALDSRDR